MSLGNLVMFTGIIERTGIIRETRSTSGGQKLCIEVGPMATELPLGASVAISGVCLTVCHTSHDCAEFDVIKETLSCTTLESKRANDKVNLERSLRVGDRLDGHFVQGHVDGVAEVTSVTSSDQERSVWLRPDKSLTAYIIPKGSVTIDGVSLTIAAVERDTFSVALIPTTLTLTTLGSLKIGDKVNIETDIVARTIVHHLHRAGDAKGITLDSLRGAGFV